MRASESCKPCSLWRHNGRIRQTMQERRGGRMHAASGAGSVDMNGMKGRSELHACGCVCTRASRLVPTQRHTGRRRRQREAAEEDLFFYQEQERRNEGGPAAAEATADRPDKRGGRQEAGISRSFRPLQRRRKSKQISNRTPFLLLLLLSSLHQPVSLDQPPCGKGRRQRLAAAVVAPRRASAGVKDDHEAREE